MFKPYFTSKALLAVCFGALVAATACNTDQDALLDQDVQNAQESAQVIPGSYIVVLKEDDSNSSRELRGKTFNSREDKSAAFEANHRKVQEDISGVLRKHGISSENLKQVYSATLTGFAAKLSSAEVASLKADPRVERVEQDMVVTLEQTKDQPMSTAEVQAQTTPWGITRIGGAVNYANGYYWAWVLDTGIDLDHPDLAVNTSYSRTFVGGTPDDQNGHGTHVAGTIAAKNNTIGVVGVAAGATVVSVRVLDSSGSGSMSGILSGVDYVAKNAYAGDVANMSLGGGAYSTLDNAVINASNQGIWFALAAGNESQNANNVSPARANGTYIRTISAHDSNDRFASFSNYANPPIDFCAPGVSIYSTWMGGGYKTISGTSMATPHAAGIMLVNSGSIKTRGYVSGDPDGKADRLAAR
jgi:subtilisin family serine protease